MVNYSMPTKQPPTRSQQKRDLYKLLVARSDLNASLRAAIFIIKNVKSIKDRILYPLTTSVVVCYARPFTANKPYGALPNKWSKFDNPRYQATHDELLQARHELFAHSDMNVKQVMIVPPNIPLMTHGGQEWKNPEIGTEVSYKLFAPDYFELVRETNTDIGRRMRAEIDKLIINLYGNMELPNREFSLRVDEGL
jgi:hypothetical protein